MSLMKKATPLHEFIKYSTLSVLGMIAISCYILADTFFVAQGLGTNGLAALNLAIPAYNFIHGTGLMLGMGGATKFSIYKSQNDHKSADVLYTNTLYLGAICSVLFMAVGLFLSGQLATLLGADSAVFDMTNTYLKVLLLFSPAFILNDILLCFVRNDGGPRLSMIATVAGSLTNIVLDYVFIFPCGMGIFGAVLATGVSPTLGVLMMLPHALKKSAGFHPVKTGLRAEHMKTDFSLGFPSLLGQVSSGIVMIVFNTIILRLTGNTGVAAYGVVANISLVVTSVYTGIAQGMQPLVSRAYGEQKPKDAHRFLRYSMILMLILSAVIYLVILIWANPIARIFNSENDMALQQIAVDGLKLYFTSVAFVGFNIVLSMYFTSVERALPAHILSLLRGFILIIPLAFLLAAIWKMTGVWLAFPLTELLVALLGAGLYVFYQRRQNRRTFQMSYRVANQDLGD